MDNNGSDMDDKMFSIRKLFSTTNPYGLPKRTSSL